MTLIIGMRGIIQELMLSAARDARCVASEYGRRKEKRKMLAFDIARTEIRNRKGLPTMKLTIDVEVCSFAKPRGSTGSIRYFRDPVNVEVKEVSDNEAPVAMRWTSRFDGPLETRWYDGSHWFAFDGVPHSVDERTFSASDIARMTMDPRDRRMAYVYSGYFRPPPSATRPAATAPGRR